MSTKLLVLCSRQGLLGNVNIFWTYVSVWQQRNQRIHPAVANQQHPYFLSLSHRSSREWTVLHGGRGSTARQVFSTTNSSIKTIFEVDKHVFSPTAWNRQLLKVEWQASWNSSFVFGRHPSHHPGLMEGCHVDYSSPHLKKRGTNIRPVSFHCQPISGGTWIRFVKWVN